MFAYMHLVPKHACRFITTGISAVKIENENTAYGVESRLFVVVHFMPVQSRYMPPGVLSRHPCKTSKREVLVHVTIERR